MSPASAAARAGAGRLPLLCRAASSRAASSTAASSRAASSKASKLPDNEPGPAYSFQRAPDEAPLFPELLSPGRRAVLMAVDPDLHGAVAALSWRNPPADTPAAASAAAAAAASAAATPAGSKGVSSSALVPLTEQLEGLEVQVFDMPVEVWKYGTRDKRQPEAAGLISILKHCTSPAAAITSVNGSNGSSSSMGGADCATAETQGVGNVGPKRRGRRRKADAAVAADAQAEPGGLAVLPAEGTAAAAAAVLQASAATAAATSVKAGWQEIRQQDEESEEEPVVRVVVEYSMPQFASGKYAWYGIGFSVGLLNGLLTAAGIQYHRVPASTWKMQMGLKHQGKEGSIALAAHLLPAAASMLKRKKDHGRAEALLMAAWGLGVRMMDMGTGTSSSSSRSGGGGTRRRLKAPADASEEKERDQTDSSEE